MIHHLRRQRSEELIRVLDILEYLAVIKYWNYNSMYREYEVEL